MLKVIAASDLLLELLDEAEWVSWQFRPSTEWVGRFDRLDALITKIRELVGDEAPLGVSTGARRVGGPIAADGAPPSSVAAGARTAREMSPRLPSGPEQGAAPRAASPSVVTERKLGDINDVLRPLGLLLVVQVDDGTGNEPTVLRLQRLDRASAGRTADASSEEERLCACGHVQEEHARGRECHVAGCPCIHYEHEPRDARAGLRPASDQREQAHAEVAVLAILENNLDGYDVPQEAKEQLTTAVVRAVRASASPSPGSLQEEVEYVLDYPESDWTSSTPLGGRLMAEVSRLRAALDASPAPVSHAAKPWAGHIRNFLADHLDVRMSERDIADLAGDIEHWSGLRTGSAPPCEKHPGADVRCSHCVLDLARDAQAAGIPWSKGCASPVVAKPGTQPDGSAR